jgi:hypothetical protein
VSAAEPDGEQALDQTRLHLLGLLCLFLAEGYRFRAFLDPEVPGETDLAAADACCRRAKSYFLAEKDDWDVAWTRYLHGEVISMRGDDPAEPWDKAEQGADDESDTELLGNIERARADHLMSAGDLTGALAHYGRAVFYGVTQQVTSNLEKGADAYTRAFYREMRLHATKLLAAPLLTESGGRAEFMRRLGVMLGEWGGHWQPAPGSLDLALSKADLGAVEASADAIADAAFFPAPGEAVLGKPNSRYYGQVNDLIERTRTQPWVKGLGRWAEHRARTSG